MMMASLTPANEPEMVKPFRRLVEYILYTCPDCSNCVEVYCIKCRRGKCDLEIHDLRKSGEWCAHWRLAFEKANIELCKLN